MIPAPASSLVTANSSFLVFLTIVIIASTTTLAYVLTLFLLSLLSSLLSTFLFLAAAFCHALSSFFRACSWALSCFFCYCCLTRSSSQPARGLLSLVSLSAYALFPYQLTSPFLLRIAIFFFSQYLSIVARLYTVSSVSNSDTPILDKYITKNFCYVDSNWSV